MKESLFLLRNPKAIKKLCRKLDKDFGCKQKTGCATCPIMIFQSVEFLVNTKNVSLGDAYRMSLRNARIEKDE